MDLLQPLFGAPLRPTQFVYFFSKHVLRADFEFSQLGSPSDIQFLTAEEKHRLVELYVTKMSQLCDPFRFPEEVEATMDWHPKKSCMSAGNCCDSLCYMFSTNTG